MAILLYAKNRNTKIWVNSLKKVDPTIDIRVYPDIGDSKDITFALTWPFEKGFWGQFENLKAICSIGAGVNHILKDDTINDNIPIIKLVDENLTQNMWEYCLGAALFYTMKFDIYQKQQQQNIWKEYFPSSFATTTIGIMGLGSIGQTVAQNFANLGFNVKGYSNSKKSIENIQTYCKSDKIEDFLENTDIVIGILPLTPNTIGIYNTDFFNKMKKGSVLINVGRGAQLVENDLIEALDTDHLKGAFFDVFEQEPLPSNHRFWSHPKIKITPHIASITNAKSVASQIVQNYHNLQNGIPLNNVVNKQKGY